MRSKSGAHSGSSSGRPLTLEKIWTPVAPSPSMARSISLSAASGLFIGREATKPGKRSGCFATRSEEHTSELQSRSDLVCRLLLEKKKKEDNITTRLFYDQHINFGSAP